MVSKDANEHILPIDLYLKVGGALLALTVVTVWVAQYDLGALNLVVAMLVAGVKGTLVALYFMHLKYSNKLYAVVLVGALLMVAIFIIFTMFDTMTRGRLDQIKDGPINKNAVIYEQEQSTAPTSDSLVPVDSLTSGLDKSN